ncbi:phospholipase D-like domain-containing protein DpdK [Solimonas sp. SE-A11]|uniref:phospholipase D-like domain-containing protein DpdK n=1 Tax=Solimonas sp. SE-A11 TaxID=3054954 RepID=UPI00259CFB4E|nr:phospholipase D-like domain-containing protein DpdK [Solimonas sp. SE-A11]MDM4769075.1 phospholipase D-like domain-containing protein DpdK [Solimonas sp. SE-A11]
MTSYKREVFKNASVSQSAVREVLTFLFAQELLAPSRHVYFVAPWISNIVIFDNRLGQFDSINPEWGKREVRLAEVMVAMAAAGAQLHVHTRPDNHNRVFCWKLKEAMSDAGLGDRLAWKDDDPHLHTKGLLTDRVVILGSMNLTEKGVGINDEAITVSYDPEDVAKSRVHFDTYEHG